MNTNNSSESFRRFVAEGLEGLEFGGKSATRSMQDARKPNNRLSDTRMQSVQSSLVERRP